MSSIALIPSISGRFKWVWYRNFTVWSKYYKASIVATIVEPFIYLVALGYGFKNLIPEVNGVSYKEFIAPGIVAYSAMYAATFECTYGSYARMTVQKTYDAIVSTPVNLDEVVAGEVTFSATKSLLSSTVIMVVLAVFGLVPSWWAVAVPAIMLLTGFVFGSMAMLFTSYSYSWDFFSYYFTLFIAPLFLISGIFFPLEAPLPDIVIHAAWLTPLYHSVELSRGLFEGSLGPGRAALHTLWLLVFGTGVFLLAVRRIKKRFII